MSNKLVSAIITTHNRKELLIKAIQSVLNQTYSPIELIVVDDASDDGTKELLTEISEKQGFQYIRIPKEESRGGNYARNIGIKASSGEYIALLDDDDEWLETKIQKQVSLIRSHPEYGMVACGRIFEYNMKKQVKQNLSQRIEGTLNEKILTKIVMTTSELLVRRDLLFEAGLFDENLKFWQEYELSIRLCQITQLGIVHEHLVLYRIIQKDKGRLTNNIEGWQNAVKYIEKKHKALLDAAAEEIRKKHKLMVARDGAQRAYNLSDKKLLKKYLNEIAAIKPTAVNKIKSLFHIYKFKFWN